MPASPPCGEQLQTSLSAPEGATASKKGPEFRNPITQNLTDFAHRPQSRNPGIRDIKGQNSAAPVMMHHYIPYNPPPQPKLIRRLIFEYFHWCETISRFLMMVTFFPHPVVRRESPAPFLQETMSLAPAEQAIDGNPGTDFQSGYRAGIGDFAS